MTVDQILERLDSYGAKLEPCPDSGSGMRVWFPAEISEELQRACLDVLRLRAGELRERFGWPTPGPAKCWNCGEIVQASDRECLDDGLACAACRAEANS